ncbi:MAG: GTP 3',8-cyclase MoaA [Desulfarculaceae bacterium]|jgi:cyclic pyranopterin phosphate synthase
MDQNTSTPDGHPQEQLVDGFGRHLTYLRLSITDRCNLRCIYCMPAAGVAKLDHSEILTLEELARVAKAAVKLGVGKIRLTGGEPMLRRDLDVLLDALNRLQPRPDLRITTNGLLLDEKLHLLEKYGVSTINLSLDTLHPERYGAITGIGDGPGREGFAQVLKGLRAALSHGAFAVKLNMVVLAGQNQDELLDFARLTLDHPLAVRFIEYMPVGRHTPFKQDNFVASEQILKTLEPLGSTEELPTRPGDGPARRYRLPGAQGELGVISALSSHFCDACNRLRLRADGRLIPCLFSETGVDLRAVLRGGGDDADLALALQRAAAIKPRCHGQSIQTLNAAGCAMSRLGG